ncbi:mandelate racemase/muconate lactonizing enzyme family protein [Luteibacter aegosomatissinici]|uniref:mandelate racemase/muconate lactonizing enzyme family protein n=1 Tax=Luteibacter aegosomatissinici TaxID=2911539 RepID=UPI001FFC2711|nr:mandelate racemase/muconate lactonizing enzyme family protein [Luteibacter aegosomatissinici]UPG94592.1 mandelate racemase/muconate lactonizing enzyme family protein [Luteibacter aegosomatissinici]
MNSPVSKVETFIVTVPRDTPYLGPLGPGERINSRGYVVRKGNGTIYPSVDRSIAVRITCDDGSDGWGETYGICAPRATTEIINDLLVPELIGRDPEDVETIWDDLYGLMRVRGCTSGFHVDAITALDIALWDLRARAHGVPLWQMLGERQRERIPGYLSGLPAGNLEERVAMAVRFQQEGHDAFKIHTAVSTEGIVEEVAALRQALGDDALLMVDLHWKFDPAGALALAERLAPYQPFFAEAPIKPEDVDGLAWLAERSPVPIAAGEEWYTEHDARLRLNRGSIAFIQPEMGHAGITQYRRIARLADTAGVTMAPHATVGTGLFLAASLHMSSTVARFWRHEWQHSVFARSLQLLETDMAYVDGHYVLPTGPGLGVRPGPRFWDYAELAT